MNTLLLEIFSEEVPSSLQIKATEDLKTLLNQALSNIKVNNVDIATYSTPCRLVALINNLPNTTQDIIEEKRGPKTTAPKQALDGFLKANNISQQDCYEKNDYWYYKFIQHGNNIELILPEILRTCLSQITFKKSMTWDINQKGECRVSWVRPIRNILCILNDKPLDFTFSGLKSNNFTFGHKFLTNNLKITIESYKDYFIQLEKNFVVLDQSIRKKNILKSVANIEESTKLTANINNTKLIDEINYLVEYPVILLGSIPEKYMHLPKEVITTVMEKNQRYISLQNLNGDISNKFIIVSNIKSENNSENVIKGNEKVLKARLEDALFFYNNDINTPKEVFQKELNNIIFFNKLGTIATKTQRVSKLYEDLFQENQNELCSLYKLDLASSLVKEITELQGIIGSYYVTKWTSNKNNEAFSLAIKDHYKPLGPNDNTPSTELGAKLAIADKLDTLISFFSIGEKPSGSKDPFALRRSTLGIIRCILDYNFDINLSNCINKYNVTDLQDFIADRLVIYLAEQGINKELARFCTTRNLALNILEINNNSILLDNITKSEQGKSIILAYKRASNILKSQNIAINHTITVDNIKLELCETPNEKNLVNYLLNLSFQNNDIQVNISKLTELKKYLDLMLEDVSIEATPNKTIKQNRINILNLILNIIVSIIPVDLL